MRQISMGFKYPRVAGNTCRYERDHNAGQVVANPSSNSKIRMKSVGQVPSVNMWNMRRRRCASQDDFLLCEVFVFNFVYDRWNGKSWPATSRKSRT
jgi:hypothetical protein